MSRGTRYIILIIRIRHDLAVVLVWITRGPSQNIGRGSTYPPSSVAGFAPKYGTDCRGVIGFDWLICANVCTPHEKYFTPGKENGHSLDYQDPLLPSA